MKREVTSLPEISLKKSILEGILAAMDKGREMQAEGMYQFKNGRFISAEKA